MIQTRTQQLVEAGHRPVAQIVGLPVLGIGGWQQRKGWAPKWFWTGLTRLQGGPTFVQRKVERGGRFVRERVLSQGGKEVEIPHLIEAQTVGQEEQFYKNKWTLAIDMPDELKERILEYYGETGLTAAQRVICATALAARAAKRARPAGAAGGAAVAPSRRATTPPAGRALPKRKSRPKE